MNAVVREWRGRVSRERADDYLDVLRATGLKNYAATPGHLGTLVLRRDGPAETEYVLLTLWASMDVVHRFAGADPGRAVYYPEDEGYLLEKPPRLHHYRLVAPAEGSGPAAWPPIAAWR